MDSIIVKDEITQDLQEAEVSNTQLGPSVILIRNQCQQNLNEIQNPQCQQNLNEIQNPQCQQNLNAIQNPQCHPNLNQDLQEVSNNQVGPSHQDVIVIQNHNQDPSQIDLRRRDDDDYYPQFDVFDSDIGFAHKKSMKAFVGYDELSKEDQKFLDLKRAALQLRLRRAKEAQAKLSKKM